ncbi:AraC family transcriptional regulator [Luxibacter massiliensis]|uniref:AraC family transcriptional regulator n=1 Tax=Luxibacter massiliensis TaxID=2219695 RepID=UPI000F054450|nr:AraC family transcriptional regulator [Luxibacter massiliensis]
MHTKDSIHEEIALHQQIPIRIFRAQHQTVVHSHDCLELNYVESGSGLFLIEEQEYEVEQGDFVVINNLERHIIIPDKGYVSLVTVFDARLLLGHANEQEFLAPFFKRSSAFSHVVRLREEERQGLLLCYYGMLREYQTQDKGWETMIKAQITQFLVGVCRYYEQEEGLEAGKITFRKDYEKIRPAVEYIHNNFKENITLDVLAARTMLSIPHFEAVFREVMKMRPFNYIQQIRIDNCTLLLTSSDLSVSEIAFASGFNNLSYFNRQFLKETGMTPREYRKKKLFS